MAKANYKNELLADKQTFGPAGGGDFTDGPAAPPPAPTQPASTGYAPSPPPIVAAPAATASDEDVLSFYPQFAWALDDPELGALLQQAAREGWDAGRLAGALYKTQWWQTKGKAQRSWIMLAGTDPAEASRRLQAVGLTNDLQAEAGKYAIPISDATALQWAQQIVRGDVERDQLTEYFREQAKSLYPGLSAAIDRGVTVEQYYDPFRQIAAQRLGVAPESITLADPKWNKAINAVDAQGNRTAMNLAQWEQTIKTDPVYGYDRSPDAVNNAVALTRSLAELFGRTG